MGMIHPKRRARAMTQRNRRNVDPRNRRLLFESLEDRCVLSASLGEFGTWFTDADHAIQQLAPNQAVEQGETGNYVSGEILIGLNGPVLEEFRSHGDAAALRLAEKVLADGALHSPEILSSNFGNAKDSPYLATRWKLADGISVERQAASLSNRPGVAFAEPNYLYYADTHTTLDDPRYDQLWGLDNTGQTGGVADADIDAPEAWDIATGSHGVVVGVIDSGIDYTHPDLYANVWINQGEIPLGLPLTDTDSDGRITFVDLNSVENTAAVTDFNGTGYIDGGDLLADPTWADGIDTDGNGFIDDLVGWDFLNNDNDPFDDNRHGTHVAGTIGAMANNSTGVVGVNWDVQLMALKFLNSGGSGPTSAAALAVDYATRMNANLTSNSWGGGGFSQALYDAIEAHGAANKLFVAAAGNSGANLDNSPHYPASYDLSNIVAVAATDASDDIATSGQLGSTFDSNFGAISVDLGAPGVAVLSTTPDGTYSSFNGTSMATPHVAGVAALAWSMDPNAGFDTIRDAILDSVDPLTALTGVTSTGGRLNAQGALQRIGMTVRSSSPGLGDIVSSPPNQFDISFSFPIDPGSLQPTDLTVNTLPADSVTQIGSNTARFTFLISPVTTEGTQTMIIAPDVISTSSSVPNDPFVKSWTGTFRYDVTPLQVTATTPAAGSLVTLPLVNFTVDFNELIDANSVDLSDLVLSVGDVVNAEAIDGDTASYVLSGITAEGMLDVNLPAGAVTDTNGNPSVGYQASLDLDWGRGAFPSPLSRIEPYGSLAYRGDQDGAITVGDSGDEYTLQLDAGQTITLVAEPNPSLRPGVAILDSNEVSLASATAAAAGQNAAIQTFRVDAAGTYTLRVSGVDGSTGDYHLLVYLNTGLEEESLGGAANDSLASAQNLETSFRDIGGGGQLATVIGGTDANGCSLPDGFGYEACLIPFEFEDISSTGTPVLAVDADDDAEFSLKGGSLSGFTFDFYGQTYNQVIIGSNGQITFEWQRESGIIRNNHQWNYGLNDTPLVAAIAPLWDDLEIVGPEAAVYWQVEGSGSDQRLIIQYHKIRFWGDSLPGDITFQVILSEVDGSIQFNYLDLDNDQPGSGGASATVGIKDEGVQGPNRILLAYNDGPNEWVGTGKSVRISTAQPPAPDVYSFDLLAGQQASLTLTDLVDERDGLVQLQLQDGAGAVLAQGVVTDSKVNVAIEEFTAATTGTYYAVVSNARGANYNLLVGRDVVLDTENNDQFSTAQPVGTSRVIAGALSPKLLPSSPIVDGFEDGDIDEYTATGDTSDLQVLSADAHDGAFGLHDESNSGPDGWIYRDDADVHFEPGDTVSTWIRGGSANDPFGLAQGRGYFGFGASDAGAYSLVIAPSQSTATSYGDLVLMRNDGYGFADIATTTQHFQEGKWYRLEASWTESGKIVGRIYDSDGTTLLNSVVAHDTDISAGGVALRAFGAPKSFDTIQKSSPVADFYSVSMAEGDQLSLTTSTPGGGPFAFENLFDPKVRIYDAAGVVVAEDDNGAADGRNAALTYTAPPGAAGDYYIEIVPGDLAPDTAGEYVVTFDVAPAPVGPGISVSRNSGLVTSEDGGTDSFTVQLDTQPTQDVVIEVSVDPAIVPAEALVSTPGQGSTPAQGPAASLSLTFTPADWDSPQTVTLIGQDDDLDDGDIPYGLSLTPSSLDAVYDSLAPLVVSASNTDDDTAGFTISPNSGLVTTELGGEDTFSVVLDSEPRDTVSLTLRTSDSTEGLVSTAGQSFDTDVTLTFTPADWYLPQNVTVQGQDDPVADLDVDYLIITDSAVSADPGYSGLNPEDVSVTNQDDDSNVATFISSDVPQNTRDLKTITSSITISDDSTIADLNVTLTISHSYDADLDVFLVYVPTDGGPEVRAELFTDIGGSDDDFLNTVLDDEAELRIVDGSAPFTGTFQPEGSLSVFDGLSTAGTWSLEITDDTRQDRGRLESWSLTIGVDPSGSASANSGSTASASAAIFDLDASQAGAAEWAKWSQLRDSEEGPVSLQLGSAQGGNQLDTAMQSGTIWTSAPTGAEVGSTSSSVTRLATDTSSRQAATLVDESGDELEEADWLDLITEDQDWLDLIAVDRFRTSSLRD